MRLQWQRSGHTKQEHHRSSHAKQEWHRIGQKLKIQCPRWSVLAARETRVENARPEVIHFGRSGTVASIPESARNVLIVSTILDHAMPEQKGTSSAQNQHSSSYRTLEVASSPRTGFRQVSPHLCSIIVELWDAMGGSIVSPILKHATPKQKRTSSAPEPTR